MLNGPAPQRRLPVYFVIDDSAELAGVFQATVSEALQSLQSTLLQDHTALRSVYLSTLYFGEDVLVAHLQPLLRFSPPPLRARGNARPLSQALAALHASLTYDIIAPSSSVPGDARPLIFELLSGIPDGTWRESQATLAHFAGPPVPNVVTLLMQSGIPFSGDSCHRLLKLNPADGFSLANFFGWVTQYISAICSALAQGSGHITDIPLPGGVQHI